MQWTMTVVGVALVAAGCTTSGTTVGSGGDDDCRSHYEHVADAPTRAALLDELRTDVDPRVQDLRVIDDGSGEGGERGERGERVEAMVTVNLLNAQDRTVMSLDMWQRDDGTWTAQRWSQCID